MTLGLRHVHVQLSNYQKLLSEHHKENLIWWKTQMVTIRRVVNDVIKESTNCSDINFNNGFNDTSIISSSPQRQEIGFLVLFLTLTHCVN